MYLCIGLMALNETESFQGSSQRLPGGYTWEGTRLRHFCKLRERFLEGPAGMPAIVYMSAYMARPIAKGFSDSQLI